MTAQQVLLDVWGASAGNRLAVREKYRCLYSVFSELPGTCSPTARGFCHLCRWEFTFIGDLSTPPWMPAGFFYRLYFQNIVL
jgi:hypothetical protein